MIPGVERLELDVHADERGSVAEVFRQEWFSALPPLVQANVGRTRPGVVRGMHYHLHQADVWVPVDGEATGALVDLREGSPVFGVPSTFDVVPGAATYIPPGVAHGFYARTDFTLLYFVDRHYDGGVDEHGFSPLDLEVAIPWPGGEPILSERDRAAPSLRDALARNPVGRSAG